MNWKETKDELARAILDHDAERVGQVVDRLRFGGRLNYDQCYELGHELTGINPDDWDELLYEADCKTN